VKFKCATVQLYKKSYLTQYGAITFNFSKCLPGTLAACLYVYADKFTACLQSVRLPNACMYGNVSCIHVRHSARPSWCPSEFQHSAAQSCFLVEPGVHTVFITAACCWCRSYCQSLGRYQGMSSCFSRTVLQHTVLMRQLSSYIKRRTGLYFTGTVAITVQILTRWITKSGLQCSSASTRQRFDMLTNCDSVCWTFGAALNKTSSTYPLTSGVCDSKHACVQEADILKTCCKFICIDIRTNS